MNQNVNVVKKVDVVNSLDILKMYSIQSNDFNYSQKLNLVINTLEKLFYEAPRKYIQKEIKFN